MTREEQQKVNRLTNEIERLTNMSLKKKLDIELESRIDDLSCQLLAIEERQAKEEEGVKAIIALQKRAGIDEPEKEARENWQRFSEQVKEITLMAYKIFCEGGDKSEEG